MDDISYVQSDIFDIPYIKLIDDSIIKYDHLKVYESSNGSSDLSDVTYFNYETTNKDLYLLPSNSYLLINANINLDNNIVGDVENVGLTCNFYNIFKQAIYQIDDQEIERIENPGISTLIDYFIKFSKCTSKGIYEQIGMFLDTENGTATKSSFESIVEEDESVTTTFTQGNKGFMERTKSNNVYALLPVKLLFPFLNEVKHIFTGVKHKLKLELNSQNQMIFKSAQALQSKFEINSMIWMMPYVKCDPNTQLKLETILSNNSVTPIHWTANNVYKENRASLTRDIRFELGSSIHKPQEIFVLFQNTDVQYSQNKNSMIFNNMNLKSIQVEINGILFPQQPTQTDFNKSYVEQYERFKEACIDQIPLISQKQYKNLYPIFYIDVSKIEKEIYAESQYPIISINVEFHEVPTQQYIIYTLVKNLRQLNLDITNKKMKIIK